MTARFQSRFARVLDLRRDVYWSTMIALAICLFVLLAVVIASEVGS